MNPSIMELPPFTDIEGMDFDIGSGEDDNINDLAIDLQTLDDNENEYDYDSIQNVDCPIVNDLFSGETDTCLDPHEGMEFESEESARIFYNLYARRVGFSTRMSVYHKSRRDGSIICRQVVCSRQGFRQERDRGCGDASVESRSKRQRVVTRVGCKAMIVVKKQESGKWVVSKFVEDHNHELVPSDKVHGLRSHRKVSGPARSLIDTLQAAGIGPSGVMSVLIKESGGVNNVGFTTVDCRNYMSGSRQKILGSGGQHILDYLKRMREENPDFYYAIQGDTDNTGGNIFWVDARARANYTYFGDTVTFDTTYRTNKYRVPFAPFTGLNHHGQPVLFGCALLFNESEASFIWLFETWLAAMSGKQPISITTDQDRVIQAAIAQVLPRTRHRFCKWSIFREAQERLFPIYQSHPNFETDFRKCINMPETTEDFEVCWAALLKCYNLEENEWLQSILLCCEQWVPVYQRNTFFGEISTTEGSDSINSFFDGYVNASTSMQLLIKQYEKAITSRHEKEVKADYDTMNIEPVLKTPSPMEKQASSLFTRRIFTKFQYELVETLANTARKIDDTGTITTYRVAKFGEDHKASTVTFQVFEMKINCSCQMFEFCGILCRHILAVFRVANILTLPSQYVLKRWTRNAKSGIIVDDFAIDLPRSCQESSSVRFNNLRQEAIKYVEEGTRSSHIYNVAMHALKEAAKKVAAAKNHVCGVRGGPLGSGSSSEVPVNEANQINPFQSCSPDEKDKKILELVNEVDSANQRCEVYRTKLLTVLRDMEEQKLKLLVKAQSVRVSLKESILSATRGRENKSSS